MCGIIAAVSLDGHNVNEEVYNQFQDQAGRGTRGFGSAMAKPGRKWKGGIKILRATDEIGALFNLKMFQSPLILFHHRQPTSSDNKIQQTHPILVSNEILEYDWLVAHNGMISNSDDLKAEHEKLGLLYSTDNGEKSRNYNDSESLAVELAMFFERAQLKTNYGIEKNSIEAKGSAAVVGLQLEKNTGQPLCLFYGRNSGNPLHTFRNDKIIFISSEGKGELVGVDDYTLIDLTHKKKKQKTYTLKVPYYYQSNIHYTPANNALGHGKDDDDDDMPNRHWEKEALKETLADNACSTQNTALEETFGFTGDPVLQSEAEEMYDDLESCAQQFVETICDIDSVDLADSYITDMKTTMQNMRQKMQDYWTKSMLAQEEKDADKVVAEAARDKTIKVSEETATEKVTPAVPRFDKPVHPQFQNPEGKSPEEIEKALQNGA